MTASDAVIQIREFREGDLEAVIAFSPRAWAPVFDLLREALGDEIFLRLYPDWEVNQAEVVRSSCMNEERDVFVAIAGGRPVGFVAIALNAFWEGMGAIELIGVDPDYQRRGISSRLMEHASEHMQRFGMDIAVVETGADSGHTPAPAVYEATGFTLLPIARYFRMLVAASSARSLTGTMTDSDAGIQIRDFREGDLDTVVAFSVRAWARPHASMRNALGDDIYLRLYPDWQLNQAETVRSSCMNEKRDVFVAIDDGRPVGFVAIALNAFWEGMGAIELIGVDPDYQRRGISSRLIEHASEHMQRCAMDIAVVETSGDPGHAPARAAYEATGFTLLPIGRYFRMLG